MTVTLDAQPILDLVTTRGGIGVVLGEKQIPEPGRKYASLETQAIDRSYHRMRKTGRVTVWAADRFCVKVLGTLPELVYGEAFFDGCDDGEVAA